MFEKKMLRENSPKVDENMANSVELQDLGHAKQ